MLSSTDSAGSSFAAFLERDLNTGLLRFTTAGSVDDGKSTLIGRLLHDSKSVYEDQLASIKKSRVNRSSGPIDFSLLTDGLRAEREQGITIDVAYRYFATPRRKFIIADTPGHEQYTRNMATGASTADLAVILIDATKGLLPQTRRHTYIASLLGISNVLVAVNKMDLVDYRKDVFIAWQQDFLQLARQLGVSHVQCIPISALEGDSVVQPSTRMDWYDGPTLLEHLETVPIPRHPLDNELRFPIQSVVRPDAAFRGFAGRLASGRLRPGDNVLALPSGQKTRVQSIVTYDGELPQAVPNMSITVRLEDEIDLSRGDMLVSPERPPQVSRDIRAMVVWLHAEPLELGRVYLVKHAGRQTKIRAIRIDHGVNVNTLDKKPASQLQMNDIGAVEFQAHVPLFFDPYRQNRTTGSFILIDPLSNATLAAGMIQSSAVLPDQTGLTPRNSSHATITNQETVDRSENSAALILLDAQASLWPEIKNVLAQYGLRSLSLSDDEIPPAILANILPATRAANLVVIYTHRSISPEEKDRIVSAAGAEFLDLGNAPSCKENPHAWDRLLSFLQSPRPNREKIN